jgi:hypothetical protein
MGTSLAVKIMTGWTGWRSAALLAQLKQLLVAASIAVIALQWVNSRVVIVWQNQNPSHPIVLTSYRAFHSMATGLREGRVGQVDLATLGLPGYARPISQSAPYERLPPGANHRWVNFYTLDIGYSFIVEAARLAFTSLPDNHLRALALQLVVDAALVAIIFFLFSQWHIALGLVAAYLYSSNQVFFDLVSFPFYYYWDIPLTFVVFGGICLAYRRPPEAARWLTAVGLALGFGVWLRSSWWPLSLFLCVVVASSPVLRKTLLAPIVAFAIVAAPQVVRSSVARGQLTFTTRAVWHVALVGLGYYPNRYGLDGKDESVFELTRQKYGVPFKYEDYFAHDQAAKQEWFSMWRNDRGFVIRSFFARLKGSITGSPTTTVRSFPSVSNAAYRFACLMSLLAMILRGGEKRLLGVAAAGVYLINVSLTCVFYIVTVAYQGAVEVALLMVFIGGLEAAFHVITRLTGTVGSLPRLAIADDGQRAGA